MTPSYTHDFRLGFISDRPMFVDDGGIWMEPVQARLLGALSERVRQFSFAMSGDIVKRELFTSRWQGSTARVLRLPYIASFAKGFFNIRNCRRIVREVEQESDVVVIQAPFASMLALLRPKRPRVYQMTADVLSAASGRQYFSGGKRLIALAGAHSIDRLQRLLLKRADSRLVAHGDELWHHLGVQNGVSIVSGTLLQHEILSVRRQRPADAPFRILYVGYLRRWKGLDILLDAFAEFEKQVPQAELQIIGSADDNAHGVEEMIRERIQQQVTKNRIRLMGNVPFGPRLFSEYANADLLVVPSKGGEGTPRVLVEALAFGCPVIGTRICGIPSSIDDGEDGLLVPPADVESLAKAMLRVARDPVLRQRLIEGGIERARRTTVDAMADAILSQAAILNASQYSDRTSNANELHLEEQASVAQNLTSKS